MLDRRFRARDLIRPGVLVGVAAVAVLALVPVVADAWIGYAFGALVLVSLATSYDILGGFGGYLNLGHASFFGAGAYAFTIAVTRGLPMPVGLAAAALVPVVFALLVGPALLRLRGVYFAIAAFGLVVLLRILASNLKTITGGAAGLALVTGVPQEVIYWAMLAIAAAAVLVTYVVARSRFGLALEAIREDEEAAEAFGVRAMRVKLAAMALSAALAGLVGAFYAMDVYFIAPETMFGLSIALTPIIAALVGGSGIVGGPLLGGVLLFGVEEELRRLVGELSLLAFGVILMLTGLFMPGGALRLLPRHGGRRRVARRRAAPHTEAAEAQSPR